MEGKTHYGTTYFLIDKKVNLNLQGHLHNMISVYPGIHKLCC